MDRWRGRRPAGLAAAVLAGALVTGAMALAGEGGTRWIVVRDAAGTELARATLPSTSAFALRYRNSLYHSTAEEQFMVDGNHLRLTELRADELAVLEEYYTAVGALPGARGSTLAWTVGVERAPIELPLRVQATQLGRRTLLAGGEEIALWRLVAGRDDTSVVLDIEGSR